MPTSSLLIERATAVQATAAHATKTARRAAPIKPSIARQIRAPVPSCIRPKTHRRLQAIAARGPSIEPLPAWMTSLPMKRLKDGARPIKALPRKTKALKRVRKGRLPQELVPRRIMGMTKRAPALPAPAALTPGPATAAATTATTCRLPVRAVDDDGLTQRSDAPQELVRILLTALVKRLIAKAPASTRPPVLTALTRRHLMPDVAQLGMKTLVLVMLAPTVSASPEGMKRMMLGLIHTGAVPRRLPFPKLRMTATARPSGVTPVEIVRMTRRQAPRLVLVQPIMPTRVQAHELVHGRRTANRATRRQPPFPLTRIPGQPPIARPPPGVPGTPLSSVPTRTPAELRPVQRANKEIPAELKSLKVSAPAEPSAVTPLPRIGPLRPLKRQRAVLKLTPFPRTPSSVQKALLGFELVTEPVTPIASKTVALQRDGVLARLPSTPTTAGRVMMGRRVQGHGDVRRRLARPRAHEPMGRRHSVVHQLTTCAKTHKPVPCAAFPIPTGPTTGGRRVPPAVSRDVPRSALLTGS